MAEDTRRCGEAGRRRAYYEAVSREMGELTLECAIAGQAAEHGVSDGALGWWKTQEGAGRRRAYYEAVSREKERGRGEQRVAAKRLMTASGLAGSWTMGWRRDKTEQDHEGEPTLTAVRGAAVNVTGGVAARSMA